MTRHDMQVRSMRRSTTKGGLQRRRGGTCQHATAPFGVTAPSPTVAKGNPKKLHAAATCKRVEHGRRRTGTEACGRWGCSGLAVILGAG